MAAIKALGSMPCKCCCCCWSAAALSPFGSPFGAPKARLLSSWRPGDRLVCGSPEGARRAAGPPLALSARCCSGQPRAEARGELASLGLPAGVLGELAAELAEGAREFPAELGEPDELELAGDELEAADEPGLRGFVCCWSSWVSVCRLDAWLAWPSLELRAPAGRWLCVWLWLLRLCW